MRAILPLAIVKWTIPNRYSRCNSCPQTAVLAWEENLRKAKALRVSSFGFRQKSDLKHSFDGKECAYIGLGRNLKLET